MQASPPSPSLAELQKLEEHPKHLSARADGVGLQTPLIHCSTTSYLGAEAAQLNEEGPSTLGWGTPGWQLPNQGLKYRDVPGAMVDASEQGPSWKFPKLAQCVWTPGSESSWGLLGIVGFKHMFEIDHGLKCQGSSGSVGSPNAEEQLVHPRAPLLLFPTASTDGVKYILLLHELFLSITLGHCRGTTDQ